MKENVGTVVRYIQVLPTIAVVISCGCAHAEVAHSATRDAGFVRYVCECAVAIVAVQGILDGRFWIVKIRWSTVDEIDVHPTVVVEVEEETAAATRLGKV